MRPYVLASFLCCVSVLLAQSSGAVTQPLDRVMVDGREAEVVDGEILVKFHPGAPSERIDAIVDAFGSRERIRNASSRFVRIRLRDGASIESAIEELRSTHGIEAAEPNYVYRILDQAAPDPLLPQQWALHAIHVPEAWGRALGAKVTVAAIDTGAQLDHPDLRGRLRPGRDFIDDDDDPSDPVGHGTMVAGLIAANRDNGIGISGIAPEASVLPLRAADTSGIATAIDLAEAILYAIEKKVDVINLSLGGPDRSAVLEEAIRTAVAEGIVVCASVGNSGDSGVLYPAAYPGVVGVGTSTRDGEVWASSSSGDGVDFVAPGVGIVSTTIGSGYGTSSGSSLAAAIFSGAAALVLSSKKDMVAIEAVGRLGSTATDVGDEGADARSGHGIPNLAAALAIEVPDFVDVAVSSIVLESRRVKKKTPPRVEVELANRGRTKSVTADVVVEVNGEVVARRNGVVVRHETRVQIELVAPEDKGAYRISVTAVTAGDANAANDTASLNLSILPDPDATYVVLYKNEPFVHTWVAYQAMQILPAGAMRTELSNNFFGTSTYAGLFVYSAPYSPPGPPPSWTSSTASGTSVAEGTWEEDEDDYNLGIPQFVSGDSFLQHFWDPDSSVDTGLPDASTICLTTGPYHSAMYTAQQWWNLAVQHYAGGQTASAYYALGRVAHLLGDMAVPDHVHLDPHPGNEGSICTNLDDYSNYEEYTAVAYRNYSGSGSPKVIEDLPLATPSFTTTSYEPLLVRLFYNQAQLTQHFDSARVDGSNSAASVMGVTADGGSRNQSYSGVGYLDRAPGQDRMDLDYTPIIIWCDMGIIGCTWRSLGEGGSAGNYYDLARAYGQIAPSPGLWSEIDNTLDYLRITYRYNGAVKTDDIVNFRDSTTYYTVPDRFMLSGPQSQMDRLFPENIRYIAGLYQLFWDKTHPPTSVTGGTTAVGQTTATVTASVNPNGTSTTLSFDYGKTTNYNLTAIYGSVGSGTTPVTKAHTLTNLSCGSVYHYRASATNGVTEDTGDDKSFNTDACTTACHSFSMIASPTTGGTVTFNTDQNCSGGYTSGTPVAISASHSSGYQFSGWTATNCTLANATSLSTTCTMTGAGNAVVSAQFTSTASAESEILTNATFASGSTGWVRSGNFYADSRFSVCRSCPGYAYLSNSDGTPGNNLNGMLYQAVTIPANATSATLSFWYSITTQETTTSTAFDVLFVSIQDKTTGSALGIAELSNLNSTSGYVKRTVNLSAYAGHTIWFSFSAATDGGKPTVFRIDDASSRLQLPAVRISPSVRRHETQQQTQGRER